MAEVSVDVAYESTAQSILTNTNTNNTGNKNGTLSQKESYVISQLENSSYGLNAIKTAVGNVGILPTKQITSVGITQIRGASTTQVGNWTGKGRGEFVMQSGDTGVMTYVYFILKIDGTEVLNCKGADLPSLSGSGLGFSFEFSNRCEFSIKSERASGSTSTVSGCSISIDFK